MARDRYTRKDADAAFERMAAALGKTVGHYRSEVYGKGPFTTVPGGWALDYNPIYGGCVVTEIVNDGGGITHPLGDSRETPAVFCAMVRFALAALDTPRRDAHTAEWNKATA